MAHQKIAASVALVTGGAGGIGKAIAEKLAAADVDVVVADVVPPKNNVNNIIYRHCDVTRGTDVDALFAWMAQTTGLPDVMVLNAGKDMHEKLTEGDPEKWEYTLQLNVMGVLRSIRAFVPQMEQNKKGDVVFISSVAAGRAYEYGGVYSATKAAVEVIAETLRIETSPCIRVTVISAGITDTAFFNNRGNGSNAESIGMGSMEPDEIADDVIYALSRQRNTVVNRITVRPAKQDF